ncbi:MAG: SURF1 family protein [Pseudomonadota bacterium]
MQIKGYRFQPSWLATLGMLVACITMVMLGLWQWQRAEKNRAVEEFLELRGKQPPIPISGDPVDGQAVDGRKVSVRGRYETQYQFLLDNQLYGDISPQPGFHVITPLHIEGSETRILVNRGWIKLGPDRSVLPQIDTPPGPVEVIGYAQVPRKTYLLKEQDPIGAAWETIWQAVEMKRFSDAVPFPVQPIVIQLDPDSPAGGFVREWRKPTTQVKKNIGYSIQWFAMAFTLFVIYVALSLKKTGAGKDKEFHQS